MSELLILEFSGVTKEQYDAVNTNLGIDQETHEGDWPAPLELHIGAAGGDKLIVVEIWESQEAQGEFMARLGPALHAAGVPEPDRLEWFPNVLGHYTR